MIAAAEEWQALSDIFARMSRMIEHVKSVNVNANTQRQDIQQLAQQYFRRAKPAVIGLVRGEEVSLLDSNFESLIQLASGNNAVASYKKPLRQIRKLLPRVTAQIEMSMSAATHTATSREDEKIFLTLEGLVPSAALSYQQAIIDLQDDGRFSFRGPALELRETLRETLDYLAPDAEVKAAKGYVQEKDRSGPTMKQKVRFILRARGQTKSVSEVPEQTAMTVEEMVGTLTRSIYDRSSIATHVALERKAVVQIKRYVVAVLHDILEL